MNIRLQITVRQRARHKPIDLLVLQSASTNPPSGPCSSASCQYCLGQFCGWSIKILGHDNYIQRMEGSLNDCWNPKGEVCWSTQPVFEWTVCTTSFNTHDLVQSCLAQFSRLFSLSNRLPPRPGSRLLILSVCWPLTVWLQFMSARAAHEILHHQSHRLLILPLRLVSPLGLPRLDR